VRSNDSSTREGRVPIRHYMCKSLFLMCALYSATAGRRLASHLPSIRVGGSVLGSAAAAYSDPRRSAPATGRLPTAVTKEACLAGPSTRRGHSSSTIPVSAYSYGAPDLSYGAPDLWLLDRSATARHVRRPRSNKDKGVHAQVQLCEEINLASTYRASSDATRAK
jgi:hypothetical protein